MLPRTIALSLVFFILGTVSIGIAYAWSEPTAAPPGNNVAAPINVGSTDQVKNGGLGVNSLAVFGNSLFGDAPGSNAYMNFGATSGSSGYGIRDNAGILEFKNDGGTWGSLQTIICAFTNCTATHVSFSVDKNGVNQSISPAVWTKLTWSHEALDTNSNFANNRFTPTVSGNYLFVLNAYCQGSGANDECSVMIQKNGVMIARGEPGQRSTGSDIIANTSIITDMNGTTDYVEAYVYNHTGNLIAGNAGTTNFSGSILSP